MAGGNQYPRNDLLRQARRRRRWTQMRLATEVGVSVTTVSRWESGIQRPELHYIEALTTKLATPAADLGLADRPIGTAEPEIHDDAGPGLRLVPPSDPIAIERPVEHTVVRDLLNFDRSPVRPRVVSIRGPGGFGKTTLAKRVCHDVAVQEAFSDGILWVETGPECGPARVVQLVADVCVQLGIDRPALTDPDQAGLFLAQVLGDRRLLLVIDNVWSSKDLNPFLAGAPDCIRLVTTQNAAVCPAGATEHTVGPMSPAEMERLLNAFLPSVEADGLLALCGGWPLLAQVVSSAVRRDIEAGASPTDAIAQVEEELRSVGPHAFDVSDADGQISAIGRAIDVGLERLARVRVGCREDLHDRFKSLAIFPASEPIPLRVLSTWWGWSPAEVRRLCHELVDRSLVARYDAAQGTIALHDVLRSYLRAQIADAMPALNRSLLDVHAATLDLIDISEREPYLQANLTYHLFEAGREELLTSLLTNRAYLVNKATRLGSSTLESDRRFAAILARRGHREARMAESVLRESFLLAGMERVGDAAATVDCLALRLGLQADLPSTAADSAGALATRWSVALRSDRVNTEGHVGAVTSLAVGEIDGAEIIVSGGEDGTVRLWLKGASRPQAILSGHTGWVDTVAMSRRRRLVASGGEDQSIRVWSLTDGRPVALLAGHTGRVRALAFTSSGRLLLSGAEDGRLCAWDIASQRLLRSLACGRRVWSIALSPDDERVAVGGEDSAVQIMAMTELVPAGEDVDAGPPRRTGVAHADWIRSVTFSDDSRTLATASGDRTVATWRLEPGPCRVRTLNPGTRVRSVALGADPPALAAGCEDGSVRIWDPSDGSQRHHLASGADWVRSVAFSSDGAGVYGACEDGVIRVWDMPSGDLMSSFGEAHPVAWSVAWLTSARLIALGTASGRLELRDASTGALRRVLGAGRGRVWSLSAALDRACLAGACGDGVLRVWELDASDEPIELGHNTERAWSVAVDPAGRHVAAGFGSGCVRVWDLPSRTLRFDSHDHRARVRSLAFDRSGRLLVSGSGDGTLRVLDVLSPERSRTLDNEGEWVRAVAIDTDSGRVAAGSGGGTIRVWEHGELKPTMLLRGHTSRVLDVRLSPGAERALSGAADGTVRLWNLATAAELGRVRTDASLLACSASPHATGIVAASPRHVALLSVDGATGPDDST